VEIVFQEIGLVRLNMGDCAVVVEQNDTMNFNGGKRRLVCASSQSWKMPTIIPLKSRMRNDRTSRTRLRRWLDIDFNPAIVHLEEDVLSGVQDLRNNTQRS
jgi:hypothetical protein